jgi:hypothetical protein
LWDQLVSALGGRNHQQDPHRPIDGLLPLPAAARGMSARSGGIEHPVRRRSRCRVQSGAAESPRLRVGRNTSRCGLQREHFQSRPVVILNRNSQASFGPAARAETTSYVVQVYPARESKPVVRQYQNASSKTYCFVGDTSSAGTCWIWSPAQTVPGGCLPR